MKDDLKRRIANLPPEKRSLLERQINQALKNNRQVSASIPKREGDGPFPLSFSQERLWFLHQLHPDLTAYNEASAFRLVGKLDYQALQKSIDSFVQRHEILRTTYRLENEVPVQMVNPAGIVPIKSIDLAHIPERERDQSLKKYIRSEVDLPFDLTNDLMLRVSLFHFDDRDHLLLIVKHHIAWDGWSIRILERELAAGYQAALSQVSMNLPELAIQYKDYACWQREHFVDVRLESQVSYWKRQLADLKSLDLPTDHPRPDFARYRGTVERFSISDELAVALNSLGMRQKATIYMVLLTAFNILLLRFTGQEDIAVGTPVAGRNFVELELMVGFFVNTLVMRTDLSGNPTFIQLLDKVKDTAFSAFEHQSLPFEMLVEAIQPERRLNRNPLIQVTFQLFNKQHLDLPELPDISMESVHLEVNSAQFDMQVLLTEDQGEIRGNWRYNTDLFDNDTIRLLIRCYIRILEAVADKPDQPINEISLLTEAEIDRLVTGWRLSGKKIRSENDIIARIEDQALRTPDAAAVIFEDQSLTYGDLDRRANQLANYLGSLGFGPNSTIGLFVDRTPEMIVGLLGVLKSGAALVPLDPFIPNNRTKFIIEDCEMSLVLTTRALESRLQDLPIERITIDGAGPVDLQPDDPPEFELDPNSLAYILNTSGSTGRPKGVMVEHQQIAAYTFDIVERLGLDHGGSFAMLQPLTVDSSLTMVFPALGWGGTIHLISRERALDTAGLAELFNNKPADHLKIAPSHYSALLSENPHPELLPRKTLILGGESLHWSLIDKISGLEPQCAIWNHYGPTETTVGVLTYPVIQKENGVLNEDQLRDRTATVPVGLPLAGTNAYVLDASGHPVPEGFPGELYIGGSQVARGYLHLAEQTARSFLPDPWTGCESGRMYRTGDLVRLHPGGVIEFLGRRDDQIKLRGYRIELGEIEAALKGFPDIIDAVAAFVDREDKGPFLAVYCVPAPGKKLKPTEILRYLRSVLPEQMVPASITLLEELPRTPHGKLDRNALPSPMALTGISVREPPQTETERKLAEIWSGILKTPDIGREDNFFELGGHSLLAIRLLARLEQGFGIRLPLRVLFHFPTLVGMAEAIDIILQERM